MKCRRLTLAELSCSTLSHRSAARCAEMFSLASLVVVIVGPTSSNPTQSAREPDLLLRLSVQLSNRHTELRPRRRHTVRLVAGELLYITTRSRV